MLIASDDYVTVRINAPVAWSVTVRTRASRVKIYDLWANLKKIARKRFMIIFSIIGS